MPFRRRSFPSSYVARFGNSKYTPLYLLAYHWCLSRGVQQELRTFGSVSTGAFTSPVYCIRDEFNSRAIYQRTRGRSSFIPTSSPAMAVLSRSRVSNETRGITFSKVVPAGSTVFRETRRFRLFATFKRKEVGRGRTKNLLDQRCVSLLGTLPITAEDPEVLLDEVRSPIVSESLTCCRRSRRGLRIETERMAKVK